MESLRKCKRDKELIHFDSRMYREEVLFFVVNTFLIATCFLVIRLFGSDWLSSSFLRFLLHLEAML